jgi:error-prone DNA polymerase
VFERYRRVVLGSRMLGVMGRVQKQGEVIHLVAERLEDLSGLLASVGSKDQPGHKPRDIYIRDLRLGSGIKLPTRDFR